MKPRTFPVIVTLGVLVASLTAAPAAGMTTEAFEAVLADMQANVDLAAEKYAAGDAEAALAAARAVAEQFAFDDSGASGVELKIKELSAVAIGDKVKAYAVRLVSAIESGKPAAEVQEIADELAPSLNRLVLVAQGKTTAASQRELKTAADVDAAVAEVEGEVDEAVRLYEQGKAAQAIDLAKQAFFTFESNGVGGDTETVDKALEDSTENLIINFAKNAEADPGLSQLMEKGAPAADVDAQVTRIKTALAEIRDLLKATLPPLNLGDANEDGRVTIVDALFVAQAALGVRAATDGMDVNRDGRVTIVDALFVAQAALGIRSL